MFTWQVRHCMCVDNVSRERKEIGTPLRLNDPAKGRCRDLEVLFL